jgi:hypothetical protein
MAEALEEIQSGKFHAEVRKVRELIAEHGKDSDEVKAAKNALPAYILSGSIQGPVKQAMNEGRMTHSGLLQLDFDALEDPRAFKEELIQDPHVLAAWLSPSGQGVKGIAAMYYATTEEEHRNAFLAAEEHFAARGWTLDTACKNANRLCFAAWDTKLKTKSGTPKAFSTRPRPAPNPKPAPASSKGFPEPPTNGIHDWLPSAARWCRNHGMSEAEAVAKLRTYDGTLRRRYQANEPEDACRLVYSTDREKGPQITGEALDALLSVRAFDFNAPPEKPVPILTLCGMPLCTPGNITNIQAPPKAGKSAALEAIIAAVFTDGRQGPDTLGFDARNPEGKALIHFDTEQSRYDHDSLVRRAIRRAKIEEIPPWFYSYSMADLDIRQRRAAIRHTMESAAKKHGGVFANLTDGIGEVCEDLNDPATAFDLVAELHTLAITFDCAIITVLHENPGSENGKTRGHLGSQLERKAETNLRLAKDKNGITTIWAERARHCYLPKEEGPCFSWNDAQSMHTSCGTAGEIKSAATRERMENEADSAFGGEDTKRHTDLVKAIMDAESIGEKAAKNRIRKWNENGVVRKTGSGLYQLLNP